MFKKQTSYIFIMICTMLYGVSAAPDGAEKGGKTSATDNDKQRQESEEEKAERKATAKESLITNWQASEKGWKNVEVIPGATENQCPQWLITGDYSYHPSQSIFKSMIENMPVGNKVELIDWATENSSASKWGRSIAGMSAGKTLVYAILIDIDKIRYKLQQDYVSESGDVDDESCLIIESIIDLLWKLDYENIKNIKIMADQVKLKTDLVNHLRSFLTNVERLIRDNKPENEKNQKRLESLADKVATLNAVMCEWHLPVKDRAANRAANRDKKH